MTENRITALPKLDVDRPVADIPIRLQSTGSELQSLEYDGGSSMSSTTSSGADSSCEYYHAFRIEVLDSSASSKRLGSQPDSQAVILKPLAAYREEKDLTRECQHRKDVVMDNHINGRVVVKRKGHRKSKTGCTTCRQRRVKCDEQLPVCANCVRHRVRCDYENLTPAELRDRYLAQLVDRVRTYLMRRTLGRERPFTALRPFQGLSNTDMRLLQHVTMLAKDFIAIRPEHGVIWKEVAVQHAQRDPFILHAFLALSSAHTGYIVKSPDLYRVALEHKTVALRGAQEAISNFSRENAESLLAASVLLCYQTFYTEDRDPSGGSVFAGLAQGIYTVLMAMGSWRDEYPLATLYYYTVRPENWPPPLQPEDNIARQEIFLSLRTHASRLEPHCQDSVSPTRRLCFNALIHELDIFIGGLIGGTFDSLPVEEQFMLTEPFARWQKCFVPSEAGPNNMPAGHRNEENAPVSDTILRVYVSDPVTRLLFAYFYCVGLLIDGLWPSLRRSGSFLVRLGPLEAILRGLQARPEWWMSVDGYAFFVRRVVDCYKIRSWVPVLDPAAQIDLPLRVAEVLWYGVSESWSLNTFNEGA
ncbi:hypothetical protein V1507DRAFT_464368 [Lipomyces tetrasporus]